MRRPFVLGLGLASVTVGAVAAAAACAVVATLASLGLAPGGPGVFSGGEAPGPGQGLYTAAPTADKTPVDHSLSAMIVASR